MMVRFAAGSMGMTRDGRRRSLSKKAIRHAVLQEEAEIGASISNRCTRKARPILLQSSWICLRAARCAHFTVFCSVRKRVYYTFVYLKILFRGLISALALGRFQGPSRDSAQRTTCRGLKHPAFPVWKALAAFGHRACAFDVFLKF
jgi:hypothetical protein